MAEEFEAHVYLDHHYPPILWNIVRGFFSSVDALPPAKGLISISMASMLGNSSSARLEAEVALERIRREVAPNAVSRLKGVFVFRDLDSLARLWASEGWGGHFEDEYLADVGVSASKITEVDANWIPLVIGHDGSLLDGWEEAANGYWSGKACPNREPVWEGLVEGSFVVWSKHSKQLAYAEIQAVWPDSVDLLKLCMNLGASGTDDGQIFPMVTGDMNGLRVDYMMKLADEVDPSLVDYVHELMESHPERFVGPINFDNLKPPDLSGYTTRIPLESGQAKVLLDFMSR